MVSPDSTRVANEPIILYFRCPTTDQPADGEGGAGAKML
jgi:hypothetical protein